MINQLKTFYGAASRYITKERLVYITIIILLLLFTTLNNTEKNQIISKEQAKAKVWKDKYGNEHATVEELIVNNLEMNFIVDSISKVLKIKPKQVTSYVKAKASIDTTITLQKPDTVLKIDTVTLDDGSTRLDTTIQYKLSFRDSTFLSIEGVVPESPQTLKVKAEAKISVTDYWKRKWFLGKKTFYTDITTNNPYIHLDGAQSVKREPKPTLKIRPAIGFGGTYTPLSQKIYFGPQAGIYLFLSK